MTNDTLERVKAEAREVYRTRLDPLAEKLLFRIPVPAGERQGQPMVLVLGNHSAGKSSFVNHLLGREVQKTGVAPTDDGFTVIAAGPVRRELRAWRLRALWIALIAVAPAAVTYMMNPALLRERAWAAAGLVLFGLAVAPGLGAFGRRQARVHASALLADLTPEFERLYQRFLSVADAGDLRALWERIRERTTGALRALGVERIPAVRGRELARVEQVLERSVPRMRAGVRSRAPLPEAAPPVAVPDLSDAQPVT